MSTHLSVRIQPKSTFAILTFSSYLAVAIVVVLLFAVDTDNKGVHQGTVKYALYNNTIFKDCYDKPALNNANNCTVIDSILKKGMPEVVSRGIRYVAKLGLYDEALLDHERVSSS